MFDVISISELQKSAAKVFRDNTGVTYVLSNNKKKGLVIGQKMMEVFEEMGFLEELEDFILAHDPDIAAREKQLMSLKDENDLLSFYDL
jgi:hypothetical protein